LRVDSGGPGRHRGGLGQDVQMESLSDRPVAVSFLAERTIFPAFGIEGGGAGAPGVLTINGEIIDSKRQYVLRRGDVVSLSTPGGGGHGAPANRVGTALAADQAAGYVTDPAPYRPVTGA
jgi:N-methylhydantoinase B